MICLDLVADGAVRLVLERDLYPLATRWIPQGLRSAEWGVRSVNRSPDGQALSTIAVSAPRRVLLRPTTPETLALDRVAVWVDDRRGRVVLRGALASSGGALSLSGRRARLWVDPSAAQEAAADLYSLLTVSAALLLAGLGRALVHAAAVRAPGGDAWLLAGDARSGKSTTCATLAQPEAGWGYLSDDQVVLMPVGDEVWVEGWRRPFHLDAAARGDEPSGERREVDAAELGLAGWHRSASLAGALFPVVAPTEVTRLLPISAADVLAGLVRQSPWLLAVRKSAPAVLALLTRVAQRPAFGLRLGRDTYRDASALAASLRPLENLAARAAEGAA